MLKYDITADERILDLWPKFTPTSRFDIDIDMCG